MAIKSETVVFHISEISKQFWVIPDQDIIFLEYWSYTFSNSLEQEQITAPFPEDSSVFKM